MPDLSTSLVVSAIPAMTPEAIDKVRRLEECVLALPQVELETRHALHGGMYARTIRIPAGVIITGALIKVPTLLIVQGKASVYVGLDEPLHLDGYNVLPASAGRKQVFVAVTDTWLTAVFATKATTVDEAERAFTDEHERLATRRALRSPEGEVGRNPCRDM